jgi:hypothetical protein
VHRALLVALVLAASTCATPKGTAFASSPADWERLHLEPGTIQPWEDGLRTDSSPGTFEWWYFDGHLQDGSTLVVVFYTKNILEVGGGLAPVITVRLTDANGKVLVSKSHEGGPSDFAASKERCAVRVGKNTFEGDLTDYAIHLDFDDVKADLKLHGTTPAWRPATGHSYFLTKDGAKYFAWLPSVPRGEVSGTFTEGGATRTLSGSGYHDHNWGDAPMTELLHDWYWGRAEVGPYTVISAFLTATDRFGGAQQAVFHLSKGTTLLADDGRKVTCTLDGVFTDEHSGKPVARVVTYDFLDGDVHWRVRYERERDLANARFVELLSGPKRFFATLLGFDGAYLRFGGKVTIERLEGERVVESASDDRAVWELMYFGKATPPRSSPRR